MFDSEELPQTNKQNSYLMNSQVCWPSQAITSMSQMMLYPEQISLSINFETIDERTEKETKRVFILRQIFNLTC